MYRLGTGRGGYFGECKKAMQMDQSEASIPKKLEKTLGRRINKIRQKWTNLRGFPHFKRSETFLKSKTHARKKHPIVEEKIVIMLSRTK
jgi:hypothetical protein